MCGARAHERWWTLTLRLLDAYEKDGRVHELRAEVETAKVVLRKIIDKVGVRFEDNSRKDTP